MADMSPGQRLALYLYSGRNIGGSALGLGGLALYFLGVIGPGWPLIVGALYLAGALAWPGGGGLAASVAGTELSNEALVEQLHGLIAKLGGRLPAPALDRLKSIETTLTELLPRLDALRGSGAISAQSSFTVHETLRRYLPDALGSYLKLPSAFARLQPIENGRTAADILTDQLGTLDESLQDIARQAYAGDATALIESERFLADKFARTQPFELPK